MANIIHACHVGTRVVISFIENLLIVVQTCPHINLKGGGRDTLNQWEFKDS